MQLAARTLKLIMMLIETLKILVSDCTRVDIEEGRTFKIFKAAHSGIRKVKLFVRHYLNGYDFMLAVAKMMKRLYKGIYLAEKVAQKKNNSPSRYALSHIVQNIGSLRLSAAFK